MKGEMITMKWNYNMNSCPIDTRVKLLSENKRSIFEGTITISHDGKDSVKGEVFIGDGDYFYKLELIAWRYCNDKIKELYNKKIRYEYKPCTTTEYKTDGTLNRYYNEMQAIPIVEHIKLSDVVDKLNEVIRKINKTF